MEWIAKQKRLHRIILDPSGKTVAQVRYGDHGYRLCSQDGKPFTNVSEDQSLHFTITGKAAAGSARIKLSGDDRTLFPPRAESLSLDWGKESLLLRQSPGREISVWRDKRLIGNVKGLLHHNTHLTLPKTATTEMAALVYALADRMAREDEIDIV